MKFTAKFQIGDRIEILIPNFDAIDKSKIKSIHQVPMVCRKPPRFGTILRAPRRAGTSYLVAFEGGYVLNGKDCPQRLPEQFLTAAARA